MGRIELAEGNDKKTSCLSSIFSYFTGSSKSVEEEYTSEKNTYPPYSDIEPVYKKMTQLDINESEFESIINKQIDSISKELREISLDIHGNPETGLKEFHAHEIVTDYLEKKGFKVTRHAFGLETAFTAEYSQGEGRRVGVCAEYDALEGLGHGCGHNLICISGIATAMAIKSVLESGKATGKVVLFGTPAEENLIGKIILTNKKAFQDNVDVCMMLHPSPNNRQYPTFLACNDVHVEFFGKASHASAAPWEGINALDAIVQTWSGISMLRQQILPTDRIHGIVTDGGQAPNVIPEHTAAYFYIRALTTERLYELAEKLEHIFEAASIATGCKVKYSWREAGVAKEVISNRPMADFYAKFMNKHGIEFPSEEEQRNKAGGSTDMGNVSYEMPVIHPMFDIHTTSANHTIDFVNASKTEEAHKEAILASKALALTAVEVLANEKFYTSVQKNFKETMATINKRNV